MSYPATMYGLTPQLVYDGDCTFCRYMVDYARSITGDNVRYRTYQEVQDQYPEISVEEFQASIQLIDGGQRDQGAAAAFKTLNSGGVWIWVWLYRWWPGFRWVSEAAYAYVSRHRLFSMRMATLLFGRTLSRAEHASTAELLIRGLSLCALAAFLSLWWQVDALMGSSGILPVAEYFEAISDRYGFDGYRYLPSVLWLSSADWMLQLLCGTGAMATLLILGGRYRVSAAIVAYLCYLSLVHAGQVFMAYQWDMLLLECLVLMAILARAPTLGVWVSRLLLFRFMFMAGAAKLLSGDPTWADATALEFHFETQPLPGPFAWYAHHLPNWWLAIGSQATLVIEIVLAFAIFLPRRLRLLPLIGFVGLELMILLTGSYNFFNALTLVLCLCLLDDGYLARIRFKRLNVAKAKLGMLALACLVIVVGLLQTAALFRSLPPFVRTVMTTIQPLYLANPYGLFAVMTTRRDELILQGSMDGVRWQSYDLPYKPGATDRQPGWATPHQPRLDWQLWFAALGQPQHAPWVYELAFALLRAEPSVLRLFERDPFDGERPIEVRIIRYRYRFASPGERAETGAWWVRDRRSVWLAPTRLRIPTISHEPLEIR